MPRLDSNTVRSPFKFLDAFELEDKQHFFGREKEVDHLYDFVNKNRLVMVYGQSGTGKTSLVQCGLAARFDVTDWYPIFVRRQDNINQSLQKKLQQAAKLKEPKDTVDMLERINARYLRPVYLIFDQFEELLILGDEKKEQLPFIQTISNILKAEELSCHIIFILREEFIAGLYHFEQEIPTLFDRRLRVEPMSFDKVSGVILRSCTAFNIELEDPKKNARQIIEYISSGRSGIPLPYLQVYMDMLYREDLLRVYGENIPDEPHPELEFTTKGIDELGAIENVLEDFLSQQELRIDQQLKEKYPAFQTGTTHQVLDTFVTDNGTKQALVFSREQEKILLADTTPDLLKSLPPNTLKHLLEELEKSRILHETESTYELAHDTLAALIDQQRTDEERQLNNTLISIRSHKATYEKTKEFPGQKVLNSLEPFFQPLMDQKRLKPAEKIFLEEWETSLKNKRIRRNALYLTVLLVMASLSVWALINAQQARQLSGDLQGKIEALNQTQKDLKQEKNNALEQSEAASMARDTAELREKEATAAKNQATATLANLQSALSQIVDNLLQQAATDMLNLDFPKALQNVRAAIELKTDSEKIRPYMLELAFFYAEIGDLNKAYHLADTVSRLYRRPELRKSNKSLHNLRAFFKNVDASRYVELVKRYYPDMIPVEGDTFSLSDNYKVRLGNYQMARTETTNWQYHLYCEATGIDSVARTQEGWPLQGNVPVVNVNWYDAVQYANWVSQQMNVQLAYQIDRANKDTNNLSSYDEIKWTVQVQETKGYRLPTEAEWEFAASGGKKAKKRYTYSGSDTLDVVGWYNSNSNSRPQAFGKKKANDLGLVDMSGNVYEWCWDWYVGGFDPEDTLNPRGPKQGQRRVLHGGSWVSNYLGCEVSNRFSNLPNDRLNLIGFRLTQGL